MRVCHFAQKAMAPQLMDSVAQYVSPLSFIEPRLPMQFVCKQNLLTRTSFTLRAWRTLKLWACHQLNRPVCLGHHGRVQHCQSSDRMPVGVLPGAETVRLERDHKATYQEIRSSPRPMEELGRLRPALGRKLKSKSAPFVFAATMFAQQDVET